MQTHLLMRILPSWSRTSGPLDFSATKRNQSWEPAKKLSKNLAEGFRRRLTRFSRSANFRAPRFDQEPRSEKDRTGFDEDCSSGRLDSFFASDYLARPPGLRGAQTALHRM